MAFSPADLSDARRFCGYPVEGAVTAQGLDVQGNSATLDVVLTGLGSTDVATTQAMLVGLRQLDADMQAMRGPMGTASAAVWKRNPAEAAERAALYMGQRRKLCAFLGVPPGPGVFAELTGADARYIPVVLTV